MRGILGVRRASCAAGLLLYDGGRQRGPEGGDGLGKGPDSAGGGLGAGEAADGEWSDGDEVFEVYGLIPCLRDIIHGSCGGCQVDGHG